MATSKQTHARTIKPKSVEMNAHQLKFTQIGSNKPGDEKGFHIFEEFAEVDFSAPGLLQSKPFAHCRSLALLELGTEAYQDTVFLPLGWSLHCIGPSMVEMMVTKKAMIMMPMALKSTGKRCRQSWRCWTSCDDLSLEYISECTKPSHSQSLANFVTYFHSQGISAATTEFS